MFQLKIIQQMIKAADLNLSYCVTYFVEIY